MKIPLGIKEKVPASPCSSGAISAPETKCEEREYFPSFYVRSKDKIELPDGRFRFVCEGKVTSRTERETKRDGDKAEQECTYDIEVYSIEADGAKKEDGPSVGSLFKAGLRKSMKRGKEYTEE